MSDVLTTRALARIQLVVATIAIVVVLGFWASIDFTQAKSNAETKVSDASLAVSELADRSMLAIDVVLESVTARLSERGLDNFGSDLDWNYLTQIAKLLPQTGAIFVVDEAGHTVAGVGDGAAFHLRQIDLSDREWFNVLRDGKAEFFVGHALKGRGVHNLFFPIAHSIRRADGTFIGAVQIGVEVTYIGSLFRSLNIGSGAHVGVYAARDGDVVARYPMSESLLEEKVATAPYMPVLAQSRAQNWMGWVHGSQDELVSVRTLDGWPLIASAALPRGEVYSGAWARLSWLSVAAVSIFAAFLMLNTLVLRQSRREAALAAELQHRVINILTVVMVLVERARESSSSIEEFVSSVRGRIRSMASIQRLLGETGWRGVSLEKLIRAGLDPYETTANTTLEGPEISLTPKAAHAVAMVFHELTTNAAKYGALSQRSGRVSVQWMVTGPSADGMLRIQWNETGGPKVVPPTRKGHGTRMIRQVLSHELGGHVDLMFATDGVWCVMTLPARFSMDPKD